MPHPAPVVYPSPALAALCAMAFPGAGQLYLGDEEAAAKTVAAEAVLVGGVLLAPDGGPQETLRITPRNLALQVAIQAHVYSVYAAYRDARLAAPRRGRSPVADHDLGDLMLAPFRPSVALSPEVALPVASLVLASLGPALYSRRTIFHVDRVEILGRGLDPAWAMAAQTPVHGTLSLGAAVSEEALFRGMLQAGMLEWWSPPTAIAGQALVFGLSHVPNAYQLGVPNPGAEAALQATVTGLLGGWMGYLAYQDRGDLSRAVAFHFWYDLLVMTLGFVTAPNDWRFRLSMDLPI